MFRRNRNVVIVIARTLFSIVSFPCRPDAINVDQQSIFQCIYSIVIVAVATITASPNCCRCCARCYTCFSVPAHFRRQPSELERLPYRRRLRILSFSNSTNVFRTRPSTVQHRRSFAHFFCASMFGFVPFSFSEKLGASSCHAMGRARRKPATCDCGRIVDCRRCQDAKQQSHSLVPNDNGHGEKTMRNHWTGSSNELSPQTNE